MVADDLDIDLASLDFPSDRLTIKDLRRLYPERLDARIPEDANKTNSLYDDLAGLILEERCFAANTYDQAREKHRDDGLYGEDLVSIRGELVRDYVKFGLASGPVHAEELAKSIERQSIQQAERHGGQGRS